jgi:hypothetical protein
MCRLPVRAEFGGTGDANETKHEAERRGRNPDEISVKRVLGGTRIRVLGMRAFCILVPHWRSGRLRGMCFQGVEPAGLRAREIPGPAETFSAAPAARSGTYFCMSSSQSKPLRSMRPLAPPPM